VQADVYGNLIAALPGSAAFSVMVVGHADEIGMMVKYWTTRAAFAKKEKK